MTLARPRKDTEGKSEKVIILWVVSTLIPPEVARKRKDILVQSALIFKSLTKDCIIASKAIVGVWD